MHFTLMLKLPLRHLLTGKAVSVNLGETLRATQDVLEGLQCVSHLSNKQLEMLQDGEK